MNKNNTRPMSDLQFVKLQKPIKYKNLDQQQIAKLKKSNEEAKAENERINNILKETTEAFKHLQNKFEGVEDENRQIQIENQNLKLEVSELTKQNECLTSSTSTIEDALQVAKAQNEGLNNTLKETTVVFKHLQNKFESVEDENRQIKIENQNLKLEVSELTKQNECLTSSTLSIEEARSPTDVVEVVELNSLNQQSCCIWTNKIHKNEKFHEVEIIIKKHKEAAKQLVKFVDENIFEDKIKNFIRESMKLLFTKKFFLDNISFKHEVGRVYVKETKMFNCLIESIEHKFKAEEIYKQSNGNILIFIKDIISDFKKAVKQTPHLWPEEEE